MAIIDPKTDVSYGLTVRGIDGQVYCDDGRKVLGWMYCDDCGEPVPVKLNRGGHPYYGCANCNNQHKPQSTVSRGHFLDRMEKISTKEANENDNTDQNSNQETHQPSQTETDRTDTTSESGQPESSGKPKSAGFGFFPVG